MTLTIEEIHAEINQLDKESKALKTDLYKLAWFMRGSLTIEQAFQLDQEAREIIAELIEENLEVTKKTQLPFF